MKLVLALRIARMSNQIAMMEAFQTNGANTFLFF
jgi:hypothetical protein